MTRDIRISEGTKTGKFLRRAALLSITVHLCFGVGLAAMEFSPIVEPGVWGMDQETAIEITFTENGTITLPEPAALRPLSLPPAERRGNPEREIAEKPPKGRRSGGGGGDPLARVTKMGVLGMLDGSSDGERVSSLEGDAVHAADGVAQLLHGAGTARRTPGLSRLGESGIGFGSGTGSGFGGGEATQRAEDLVASFGDGTGTNLVPEKRSAVVSGGGLPFIEGGGCREEAEIARVVQSRRGGIRGCYNKSLLREPELEGEITVRFIIGVTGMVTSASILARTFHDPEMEACLSARIMQWTFPPEPGCETVVRYSFHFSTGE